MTCSICYAMNGVLDAIAWRAGFATSAGGKHVSAASGSPREW